MRVLLTGATGFLGTHTAIELRARGHQVRALVRPKSDTSWLEAQGFELYRGRFDQAQRLEAAVAGVDAVVHCAGGGKVRSTAELYDANVVTTRALRDAALARAPELRRFVLVSSLSAAGPSAGATPRREDDPPAPCSHYGKSKLEAERLMLDAAARLPVTIVRPPAVYGPWDTRMLALYRWARRGLLPGIGRDHTTSIVYGPDCARAIALALEVPHASGRAYFVEDGRAWRTEELGQAIAAALGVRGRSLPLPIPLLRVAGAVVEWAARLRRRPVAFTRDKVRDIAQPHWLCSSERARTELGWAPSVTFPEGAALTARWYGEQRWL